MENTRVAIIGAGQGGLALSYHLTEAGVEHLVLEKGRLAQTWRSRWDSFCLVTPNWTVRLPGGHYDGDAPDGFMPRDEIVSHFERWASGFKAPVQENVEVSAISRMDQGGFVLHTSSGDIQAQELVLATGAYQRSHLPGSRGFPPSVEVLDTYGYTNPSALPPGGVLVIGSGQTGCQLAEEVYESGREVYLACGRAPWLPRRLEGRDIISWVNDTPFLRQKLSDLPSPMARLGANPQASGHDGGHDLHYRTLQAMGVTLTGRLAEISDGQARFADDLAASVEFGDARYTDLCGMIRQACEQNGTRVPGFPVPPPFVAKAPDSVPLDRLGAVIYTAGFRPDYAWVGLPEAFDAAGFPLQVDGSSTVVGGLHFMGLHFQRVRGSATLLGVGEDAEVLAGRLVSSAA